MFELMATSTEKRVPLGEGPQLALSSPVDSSVSAEVELETRQPSRPGSLALLISDVSLSPQESLANFVDDHFLDHERVALERAPSVAGFVAASLGMLQIGRRQSALELLTKARGRCSDYWLEHYYAITLNTLGRFADAEDVLKTVIHDRPNDWRPLHALGRIQMNAGRWATAMATLKTASSLPESAGVPALVFSDLGTTRISMGEIAPAIKSLRKALLIDPRCTLAHNNLGVCYLQQNDHARAQRSFGAALACNPRCVPAIHNLAESYIVSAAFDRVVELLDPHVQDSPNDFHAIERLAWAHFRLGSTRRAIVLLRDSAKRSVQNREALLNNLAIVHRAQGNAEHAEAAFQLALDGNPRLDVRINYALMLRDARRWNDVVRVLPAAAVVNAPAAIILRVEALTYAGMALEAKALLTEGLRTFPTNEGLVLSMGHLLCSHLNDPEAAIRLLREFIGTQNTIRVTVANNFAYALIKAGHLDEARAILAPHLQAADDGSPSAICIRATAGLLAMRDGEFEAGLAIYRDCQSRARGQLAERLKQKILVEEGRSLLRNGHREIGTRKLQRAISMAVDPEFTGEANALLRKDDRPN